MIRGPRATRRAVLYLPIVPLLRILVLAIALAHATGLTDLMIEAACGADCDEPDCRGSCPPACPTCHCAPRCPVGVTKDIVVLAPATPAPVTISFRDAEAAPSSPDPREILHVPIDLLDRSAGQALAARV
jgi:hypothetical protein